LAHVTDTVAVFEATLPYPFDTLTELHRLPAVENARFC